MPEEKKIVEVKVTTQSGDEVPVGIMNTSQALKLPDDLDVAVSHPDEEAGATDNFIGRDELNAMAAGDGAGGFPEPTSQSGRARSEQARDAVRTVLENLVAEANDAGWGTDEITTAITEAARSLREAASADPDPAADPDFADAAHEQIGHGEQYD